MTRLAIVGAMHEEIAALRPCLEDVRTERRAGRDFHLGRLDGRDVILVRCGIGKVAAATTAAVLLQHDMNAEPLFPRWEVPLTGRARFDADAAWTTRLVQAGRTLAMSGTHAVAATIHRGLVISGDRFVATRAESDQLRALLPDALSVEMEGAAVAQVCHDFARPFAVVRTISDRADDAAHGDFQRFVCDVAAPYSRDIVRAALALA